LGLVVADAGRFRKRAERFEQIDRHRKDGGGIVFGRDLLERLQIAKLERYWTLAHDLGGIGEPLRRLEFALRRDHLGAPLALGLSLRRDRALHVLRQIDIFQLNQRDLHAPRLGLRIDYFLDARVELVALAEQFVELGLAADGAQRGLRQLHRGEQVVCDLGHGARRVDDAKIQHRADLDRHVVLGDDVLRRDVERHGAKINSRHPLEYGNHENHARPAIRSETPESKNDAALVFVEDLEPAQNENYADEDDYPGSARHRDSPSPQSARGLEDNLRYPPALSYLLHLQFQTIDRLHACVSAGAERVGADGAPYLAMHEHLAWRARSDRLAHFRDLADNAFRTGGRAAAALAGHYISDAEDDQRQRGGGAIDNVAIDDQVSL